MPKRSWRWCCVVWAAPAFAVVLSGCQSGLPIHTAEADIAEAVAVSDAVVFPVEGGPLDDPAFVEGSTS